MKDPIEAEISEALDMVGVRYVRDGEGDTNGLDFYLPDDRIHIEVKQFHSDRIAQQTSRAENVIVIQGRRAAEWFAHKLRHSARKGG